MVILPARDFLDQFKKRAVERNETIHDPNCVPNLLRVMRRKDNAHGRFGRAFHHGLSLFVEAGGDGVMLFECDKQRR
jgi:hypothetical protein